MTDENPAVLRDVEELQGPGDAHDQTLLSRESYGPERFHLSRLGGREPDLLSVRSPGGHSPPQRCPSRRKDAFHLAGNVQNDDRRTSVRFIEGDLVSAGREP